MTTVSFHFHGYQPGDILRWSEPDPLVPQSFEERVSPVAHVIADERIAGRNWTDTVLRTYGRMGEVLRRADGAASVDIEPQTLVWLLERDPDAYRRILRAYEDGAAGLALTPPFHPILPHHYALEREALFELMMDFYAPLLRRNPYGPVGLWLPEAAYSRETIGSLLWAARQSAADLGGLEAGLRGAHLLLDGRQVAGAAPFAGAWGSVDVGQEIPVMGRDHGLSSEFAFGATPAVDFTAAVRSRMGDSVLVAGDLESLLANPAQAERFEAIIETLRSADVTVSAPRPLDGRPSVQVVDYSSWSDYDEYLIHGHTSDTRWTGLRRADGVIVARMYRGRPMSQLWKHAFTLATERVEAAVRRAIRAVLVGRGVDRPADAMRKLAVAYGRHVFREHYLACGVSSGELDLGLAMDAILGGRMDLEVAGWLARGYLLMLMGLRSDPRFWENPDTRVTFQNVALLSQSLADVAEACVRSGDAVRGTQLLRLLQATFVEFPEAYERGNLASLHGLEGWETTEAAWHESLQSEVPSRSGYDVFRRATLYAVGDAVFAKLSGFHGHAQEIVADTGHIAGEAHGAWENAEWCEQRVP